MSRLLLDTTLLIDADRSALDLRGVISDDDEVAVAAVTIAELMVGVLLAPSRHRSRRRAFVEEVIAAVPVVDYGLAVAADHADMLVAVRRAGRPRGAHDLIVAATARATNRTIVTADREAFEGLSGVEYRTYR